jgi:hypothetical protein
MKTEKGAWPSLETLPPSVVFQTLEFIKYGPESKARLEILTSMVEQVEAALRIDVLQLMEPSPNGSGATAQEVSRWITGWSAFISSLESGVLEYDLRVNGTSDLVVRYLQAYEDALAKAKGLRAILVAAVDNALGVLRKETLEQRLRRSIKAAGEADPIYLGNFEHYADDQTSDE